MFVKDPNYLELSGLSNVVIDLKYASSDNFMREDLYGPFKKAFLHRDAAIKFTKACELLAFVKPRWSFVIYDALRPRSVQWKMWAKVEGTPDERYIADPRLGSPHNYGMALDIGLLDEDGKTVDMGAGFDEFSEGSETRLEERFLKEGRLTAGQIANRKVLRDCMTGAGFLQLPYEWWHCNAFPEDEIRANYRMVESV